MVLSDGVTPATGKTVTLNIIKNGTGGGASATGAITELDAVNNPGWYTWTGNGTDRNTVGDILCSATAAGCNTTTFTVGIVNYDPFNQSQVAVLVTQSLLTNMATTTGGTVIPISVFQNTQVNLAFKVVDASNNPVNLNGDSVEFLIHNVNASTATATIAATLSQSDPSGHPGVYDTVNVSIAPANTATNGNFMYKVRDTTANAIYASGSFNVIVSP